MEKSSVNACSMQKGDVSKLDINELVLPADLKGLTLLECKQLCFLIRKKIINTVLKNGGHLASNLGTVELSVALHRVFDTPSDKIVWDVGHQSYTHKILTGRYKRFYSLRKRGGISGFTKPSESKHDAFISGHSSTSISVALGLAEAMILDGDDSHRAIAVIGDGAFTGGLAYEGLNNAGRSDRNIIVILNDNEMSISRNVGSLSKYLTYIRGNQKYLDTKKFVADVLERTPVIGVPIRDIILSSKSLLKHAIYHSTLFESFGFVYLGPVNGHNLEELEDALRMAKRIPAPVFVHVNTKKGKGYKPAEENPMAFHGVTPKFEVKCDVTFSKVFGNKLVELAEIDKNICAITAAMADGTGLRGFSEKFPERFYDVGIAESHAVTFAGGLAKGGKIPVFAVYSSFIQRSFDQIVHDISIDNLHAIFAIDRAGIVGEDGATHHGIFDIPIFTSIENSTIYCPSNFCELENCLKEGIYDCDGAVAIRYPRGGECNVLDKILDDTTNFSYKKTGRSKVLAISYGRIIYNLCENFGKIGDFDILKLVRVFPIEDKIVEIMKSYDSIIIFEESNLRNGIAEKLSLKYFMNGGKSKVKIVAINKFVPQNTVEDSICELGLDSNSMKNEILKLLSEV